jgi:WD40 repeat protein
MPRWIGRLPRVEEHWNALLQTLEGHSHAVNAVAFSRDGQLLASASFDLTVRLWSPASGVEVKKLEGHSLPVNAVAFSPDGQQLASASGDGTVRLWNPVLGMEVKKLGHSNPVNAVAFSRDGKQLASVSLHGTVRLWGAASGEEIKKLVGHSVTATAVAFSPDSKQLAVASLDGTVRLWDAATGEEVKKIVLKTRISSLRFFSDSQRLETDRGTLIISSSSSSLEQFLQKPSDHIFLNDKWIARNGQNFLWLPYNYRGRCSALSGSLLVIGQASGAVSFFEFT